MCKSKEQKQKESNMLATEKTQMASNDLLLNFMRQLQPLFEQKQQAEDRYMQEQIDPYLNAYGATGFAPGERENLRLQAKNDAGQAFRNASAQAGDTLDQTGYLTDAPSGVMPAMKRDLATAHAQTVTGANRAIDAYGADRRFQAQGMKMGRAAMFNPMGWAGTMYGSRPGGIQDFEVLHPDEHDRGERVELFHEIERALDMLQRFAGRAEDE